MTHSEDGGREEGGGPSAGPKQSQYLKLLRERFPSVPDVWLRSLMQHETFRDLCEEYAACAEVLQRLTQSATDDAMRSEYSALSFRLEGELLRYISEHGGGRSRPPER